MTTTTTYYAKRDDVGSFVTETLLDGDGAAVNLAGATVRFLIEGGLGGDADVLQVGDGSDGTKGMVRYTYIAADVAAALVARAEWEVTYAGGAIETFPADGWISFVCRTDLDVVVP